MNSLIYFNNCASTQDELIDFLNQHYLSEDFLAVYTFNQTKGRGQYGNSWENLPEENLAYSFALKAKNINVSDTCFNFYTAILVRDFIANLTKTEVKIKWPNDLILKNKKICGMLFEKNKNYFVVGIGINILQENFKNLPKAGSVLSQTGLSFELKAFTESLHQYLFEHLVQKEIPNNILELYHLHLYRKNEVSVFEKNEVRQNGIIQNVDENGYIWIDLENEGLQKFFHKEIEMLY
ncbi:biotin--[acetyl-CoA-carboxylase] ligase [Cloacibacterium normanense]|uniref:Biotin--[acetyl-CoA-carboxylase] ligase n=1 Tax=Cloacibacterium normanense TaxID=237258 RepID=A0A2S7I735_9FLAO|nr:biotin--[acetyl-CoA-carboxylase] ligase [Cloacibacterium normanense]PPZ92339.1 biotin--[acetyl-CoA-carboxylase] ligase [Cloacibacterium normanense]